MWENLSVFLSARASNFLLQYKAAGALFKYKIILASLVLLLLLFLFKVVPHPSNYRFHWQTNCFTCCLQKPNYQQLNIKGSVSNSQCKEIRIQRKLFLIQGHLPKELAEKGKRLKFLVSFKIFIDVQLIYNIVLVSGVQQSGSIIHTCLPFFPLLVITKY